MCIYVHSSGAVTDVNADTDDDYDATVTTATTAAVPAAGDADFNTAAATACTTTMNTTSASDATTTTSQYLLLPPPLLPVLLSVLLLHHKPYATATGLNPPHHKSCIFHPTHFHCTARPFTQFIYNVTSASSAHVPPPSLPPAL